MNTQDIARELRRLVIKMLANAGSGHTAGALDLADVYAVLYFSDLFNLNPNDPARDRIVVSNGHTCPLLYAVLAQKGLISFEELNTLRQFGSRLQGHPHKDFSNSSLPGLENTSGPLGQGVGFSVGLALGLLKKWEAGQLTRLPKVVCLCGDGELQEGQVWEAFMAAAKFKLTHLTFIIDRNGIQIDGYTEAVMPLEPLKQKLDSFGLLTIEADGHNHQSLTDVFRFDSTYQSKPTAIIAHTVPGKGIGFMEGKPLWHGRSPDLGEAVEALQELRDDQPHL